jgi:hypothetical protein
MPSFFVGCVQGAELEESSQPEQPNPGKTHGELRFEEYFGMPGLPLWNSKGIFQEVHARQTTVSNTMAIGFC